MQIVRLAVFCISGFVCGMLYFVLLPMCNRLNCVQLIMNRSVLYFVRLAMCAEGHIGYSWRSVPYVIYFMMVYVQ